METDAAAGRDQDGRARYVAGAFHVRGADGGIQTRSASLRLRLEPALLDALRVRVDQGGGRWPDGRGAGVSAHVRALIVADLVGAGVLDQDAGSVRPGADDPEQREAADLVSVLEDAAAAPPDIWR